ncbi:hypothetical protein B0H14DRAFT_3153208 [Mycena olivaceomarginata]|nr:hypothetical protein B0H14DRAFT_3153208 [Mycena olivaceomarginata]
MSQVLKSQPIQTIFALEYCSTHLRHEPPLVADGYPAEVLDKVTAEERVSIRKSMPDRSTARDFRQLVSASVSVPSNRLPTNIGTGVAGITPQLESLLSDLRQLDSLLTSVSSAVVKLLSAVTDLVKNLVGSIFGQTSQSGITSAAAKPTCGNQISTVGQRALNQLTSLVGQINKIIGAFEKCKANAAKLATLKAALTDLVGKLSIFYLRLSSECDTPAHADALTAAYQNLLHTLNN